MNSAFKLQIAIALSYILYILLLIFAFIKINHRLKYLLNNFHLTTVLYHKYNVLTIIKGPLSFFGLLILTLIPIVHFSGYFLVFAVLTEYNEKNILSIIINKEVNTFRKELLESNLHAFFIDNLRYPILKYRINFICDYFSMNNCYDNPFLLYQFFSLKASIHTLLKQLPKTTYDKYHTLNSNQQAIIKIDKSITSLFNIIKKHEILYSGIS